MEVFYEQEDNENERLFNDFLKQLFNRNRPTSKSDLEMFTDVYKTLRKVFTNTINWLSNYYTVKQLFFKKLKN